MYYDGNAIYKYILDNEIDNYKFTTGDVWQLVYGDSSCNPKLLVLLTATGNNPNVFQIERMAGQILKRVSDQTQIPLLSVRFDGQARDVEKVQVYSGRGATYQEIDLDSLKEIFRDYGLPVRSGETGKYLNDATSSAYHKWQRNELGRDLKVSDFDLWKVNNQGDPLVLFELKRSIISIERWRPYEDDYNNFKLLYNVLKDTEIAFKILYNVRIKTPRVNDDISQIKIFNVDFSNDEEQITFEEILTKEEFFPEGEE